MRGKSTSSLGNFKAGVSGARSYEATVINKNVKTSDETDTTKERRRQLKTKTKSVNTEACRSK